MQFTTADLCDAHESQIQVAEPVFRSYGRLSRFSGPAATIKVFEDNSRVRQSLEEPGQGRVLVIDGGGSLRCALVGDQLARLAMSNNWAGLVIFGCVRDSKEIDEMPLGIKALNTIPRKSIKRGEGERDVAVTFASITVHPGDFVYSDEDGLVIASTKLV